MNYTIGIDLGGTKTEIALLKKNEKKPIFRKRIATYSDQGYQKILSNIQYLFDYAKNQLPENSNFQIGVGIPGFIDEYGKALCCNTQCLNGKNFKKDLEQVFQQKILVENDANCFALSEAHFGSAQNYNFVLGVIIGTGMGGGLIYKKKILPNLHGYAGEIGHISSNYSGIDCWCGQKGCHENYFSGTGIQKNFLKMFNKKLTVKEIYEASLAKNKQALIFMEEFLDDFGRVMANITQALSPDIIVLGGGVSNLPIFYDKGKKAIKKYLPKGCLIPEIAQNQLGRFQRSFWSCFTSY